MTICRFLLCCCDVKNNAHKKGLGLFIPKGIAALRVAHDQGISE